MTKSNRVKNFDEAMALLDWFQAEMEKPHIEEIVDDWAKSPVMPMNDFFINPETDNYRKWAEVPGCYRVVEDPSLSVTLYMHL